MKIEIYTCPYMKDCRIEVYPDGKRRHKIVHPVQGDVMGSEQVWRTHDGYLIIYMSDALFDGLYQWMSSIALSQGHPPAHDEKKYKVLRDGAQKVEYRREDLKPKYEKSETIESSNNDVPAGSSPLN